VTTFLIVGAGLAGAKAAETLRSEGFDGSVILLGAEAHRPYERPPLSKGYLLGKEERESAFVHPADWYAEHDVDFRSGVTVTSIDRAARTVTASTTSSAISAAEAPSASITYDKLLLTTGAYARPLDVPGAALDGVYYLRTVGESERLRAAFGTGARVVIVGAGWIGLETAAAARIAGCPVTIVERDPTPLWAMLGPELGEVFGQLHREHAVEFRFGETVTQLLPSAQGELPPDSAPDSPNAEVRHVGAVVTSGGATLPADVVVIGIGAIPNDGLVAAAGLEVSGGVVTDASLRTSDPDIYAAGDVARSFNPVLGRQVRVDHWSNALNGGPAAARAMLGQDVSYDRVPYFFSDQYDLGMECSGLPSPGSYDEVVYRGDVPGREFIAFWLYGGRLVAGMNVNVWDVTDDIQSLIRSGRALDQARLSDPAVPLSEL
jgi:3-phenylpropionate/trans-cinnamate dioxygenase ferredoxin reductase subunit